APTQSQQKDDEQAQDELEARIPAATWAAIKSSNDVGVSELLNVVRTLRTIGFTLDGITALLERYPDGLAKSCSGPVRHYVEIAWSKLSERNKPPPTAQRLPLIVELGSKLWGPATKVNNEYRFGPDQSKVIDPRKGIWFDFETNEGGFIKDLMKKVEPR